MESETIRSANSSQHISFKSEPSENVVSVTSTPRSQPPGHLKELIPSTDPTQVAVLWSSVLEEANNLKPGSATEPSITDFEIMNRSSRGRGRFLDQPARRPPSRSHLPDDMPCNIGDIDRRVKSARDHFSFKLVEDPGKQSTFYEAVLKEYELLTMFRSSSTGFCHQTDNRFFDLNSLCSADQEQGQPSAVKMNISATKTEAGKWQAPPDFLSQRKESFPPFACAFGLSEQACGEEIREYLYDFMFVLGGRMMFPYLTIDFRKDQEHMQDTIQRAACHGTQSLYNRHRLYLMARERLGEAVKARDNTLHSHFMIVFDSAKYEGWQITADHDDKWEGKGCTMKRLFGSELLKAVSVRSCDEWIRHIHYWGATEYRSACIEDIRTYLMASRQKRKRVG